MYMLLFNNHLILYVFNLKETIAISWPNCPCYVSFMRMLVAYTHTMTICIMHDKHDRVCFSHTRLPGTRPLHSCTSDTISTLCLQANQCTTWVCYMGVPHGHITWVCQMGIPHRHTTWVCQMGIPHGHTTWVLPDGYTTWIYHMGVPDGHTTLTYHMGTARWAYNMVIPHGYATRCVCHMDMS